MGLELFDVCERGAFLYHGVKVGHSMLCLQPRNIGAGALICSLHFHLASRFFKNNLLNKNTLIIRGRSAVFYGGIIKL
jgi:hypothetical protein